MALSGVYLSRITDEQQPSDDIVNYDLSPDNEAPTGDAVGEGANSLPVEGRDVVTVSRQNPIDREPASTTSSPRSIEPPLWRKNAVQPPALNGKIPLAIVIDDMGHDMEMTDQMATLPRPMTFSFLPYISNLQEQAKTVSVMGHELMLHLPMEPSGSNNPGPNALVRDLPYNETLKRLRWNLDQFEGYVGINNHMGSQYTTSRSFMFPVLQEVHKRELLFLDSRTSANSVGMSLSEELDIPTLERDVFLDNVRDLKLIERQLETLEKSALSKGYGIAIGHPYNETYQALRNWLPTLDEKGFILWPISAFIDYQAEKKAGQ